MNKAITKALIGTIINFFVLSLLNIFLNYLSQPSGQIAFSKNESSNMELIMFSNWSDTPPSLDAKIINLDSIIETSNLSTNISEINNISTLTIFNLKKDKSAYMLLKYKNHNGLCEFINAKEKKYLIGISRPRLYNGILTSVLPMVVVYFIFLLIIYQYIYFKTEKFNTKLSEIDQERLDDKKKLKETSEEIVSLRSELTRIHSVLQKENSKYRLAIKHEIDNLTTELQFFHNIFRELFIRSFGKNEIETRKIIQFIRESLKTKGNYSLPMESFMVQLELDDKADPNNDKEIPCEPKS